MFFVRREVHTNPLFKDLNILIPTTQGGQIWTA